jgi:hypothetical protein
VAVKHGRVAGYDMRDLNGNRVDILNTKGLDCLRTCIVNGGLNQLCS